jgi:hypothetical protein
MSCAARHGLRQRARAHEYRRLSSRLCDRIRKDAEPVSGKPGNGKTLWKISDPLGCEVVLDVATWDHILAGHPEMANFMDAL